MTQTDKIDIDWVAAFLVPISTMGLSFTLLCKGIFIRSLRCTLTILRQTHFALDKGHWLGQRSRDYTPQS